MVLVRQSIQNTCYGYDFNFLSPLPGRFANLRKKLIWKLFRKPYFGNCQCTEGTKNWRDKRELHVKTLMAGEESLSSGSFPKSLFSFYVIQPAEPVMLVNSLLKVIDWFKSHLN